MLCLSGVSTSKRKLALPPERAGASLLLDERSELKVRPAAVECPHCCAIHIPARELRWLDHRDPQFK
jgi:hypothetical protein